MGTMLQEASRDQVREQLRIYMSKTGLSISEIAFRAGYSRQTVNQFVSLARYGDSRGHVAARRLAKFMKENPAELPDFPGRLYETAATREMDRLIEHAAAGGWGTIYGPAGAQKTFLMEYRAAEAAREEEREMVLIGADPGISPRVLLGRIARCLAAPWAQQTEALRDSILYSLRRRKRPAALLIDEAQLLYPRVDTLETLRRLGDKAGGRLGILVAGNEQVLQLFEPRRNVYFEQWRSRIEQRTARILGPTTAEARSIVRAEIPQARDAVVGDTVDRSTVQDPESRKTYVNARRLFHRVRMFQRELRRRANRAS